MMPEFGVGEATWNRLYLDAINKHADGKGRLLEIAFGNASFLKLARDDGWQVYGTELGASLANNAREEFGFTNIGLGTIHNLDYPDGHFDVICGFNFLEHVPDPRQTLEHIFRLLRPAGVLAVMCPNIDGIFHRLMPEILGDNDPLRITWVPPEHISYFNRANLKTLLESVGFIGIADESHGMSSLWRQFEPQIGPDVTAQRLKELIRKIEASPSPPGFDKVAEGRQAIKKLLVERMTWTMLSDLMELEPALGSEVGILLLGTKPGG
jgi:SAM-dependent methyltransferase